MARTKEASERLYTVRLRGDGADTGVVKTRGRRIIRPGIFAPGYSPGIFARDIAGIRDIRLGIGAFCPVLYGPSAYTQVQRKRQGDGDAPAEAPR
jgi:hypothetical protein